MAIDHSLDNDFKDYESLQKNIEQNHIFVRDNR